MLGCAGFPLLKTPHIDAFAREGVRFTEAFCNYPACVPSRHSFISGLYPHEIGIRSNQEYIPRNAVFETIGTAVKKAGYVTAAIGKMHWKPLKTDPALVDAHKGFDYRSAFLAESEGAIENIYRRGVGEETYGAFIREFHEYDGPGGESVKGYVGTVSAIPADSQQDGWLARDACAFIERQDGGKPFLLVVSLDRPHPPSIVPPEFSGLYDPANVPLPPAAPEGFVEEDARLRRRSRAWSGMTDHELRSSIARYMENITYVDHLFGSVVGTLKKRGLSECTAVFFFSDHGELLGGRGGCFSKYCLYDSALRVPLVVRWPGVGKEGAVVSAPVELIDLFPTWLDIAGLPAPEFLPGRSLRPLLKGKKPEEIAWRETAFAEMYNPTQWALRTQTHKLIVRPGGANALYELKSDPHEFLNRYHDTRLGETKAQMLEDLANHAIDRALKYPELSSRAPWDRRTSRSPAGTS